MVVGFERFKVNIVFGMFMNTHNAGSMDNLTTHCQNSDFANTYRSQKISVYLLYIFQLFDFKLFHIVFRLHFRNMLASGGKPASIAELNQNITGLGQLAPYLLDGHIQSFGDLPNAVPLIS